MIWEAECNWCLWGYVAEEDELFAVAEEHENETRHEVWVRLRPEVAEQS